MNIEETVKQAVQLRDERKLKESNELLIRLAEAYPENPEVRYQCAWSLDVLGLEAAAVPHYEKAIEAGLTVDQLKGAYLGLGSTYRTLGEYDKSKKVLSKGIKLFPNEHAIRVFYALSLYNLGEHHDAMELLLTSLLETTSDESIRAYEKALTFYKSRLDEVWT
ncbi:tetratricopeptide repeat protein [Jeotgalibacillus sp. R-1-5s-1]|uniref:tetratricopeptide repeat protein n=1 Tax=Jeotgalibacillus sp. R-1-5s-1 TaxID=2555897 RepID=UPI00106CB6B1|nr:tetratricopeptide repeat protein [Jeotgalibacillus sp. R-1-5s-1]